MSRCRTIALSVVAPLAIFASSAQATLLEPQFAAPQAASTGPSIAGAGLMGANGRIVVASLTNGDDGPFVEGIVRDPGGDWSAPAVVADFGAGYSSQPGLAVSSTGRVVMIWTDTGTPKQTHLTTIEPGSTTWTTSQLLTEDGNAGGETVATAGPDGVVYLAWTEFAGGQANIRVATLGPESPQPTGAVNVASSPTGVSDPRIIAGPDGRVAVGWADIDNGDQAYTVAHRESSGEAFKAPARLSDLNHTVGQGQLTYLSNNDLAVAWTEENGGDLGVHTSTWDASADSWSPSEQIGGASTFVPAIAGTTDGHTVLSTVTLGSGYSSNFTSRVLDGAWDAPAPFQTPWPTGALAGLTALKDGSVVGLALVGDQDGLSLATSRWTPASGTFSSPTAIPGSVNDPGAGNSFGVDAAGDAIVAWKSPETGLRMVSIGDATAPRIDNVQAPAGATVDESASFAASASDDWSDIESIEWNFGDGGTAEGGDVTHKFRTAGTRTVTVTVTDSAGHTKSATRSVTVSSPPVPPTDDDEDTVVDDVKPPAKPPVIAAPIVEAKLAGKVVTYSVKLSLKKGQSCSGTVTATFTFGNKRYTSKLKLKKVGTACRATGKTTLKKSPSARTKITVKLSGKQIKTRSLSTKRA